MPKPKSPAVAFYLKALIEGLGHRLAFQDLVTQLLSRPGRVLSPAGPAKWPSFTLLTCRALGGDPSLAVAPAAAVELALAAGDVIDDVVDDEWSGSDHNRARALNASLALLQLSQLCVADMGRSLGAPRALLVSRLLSEGILSACKGEDLDLLLEAETQASEEAAYEMTDLKSGSLVAMACQVGAAVAIDDPALLQLVGKFGRNLGIIAQVLNDIHGISDGGSDLRRRKKTLPVAFALRCASEENIRPIADWYEGRQPASGFDEFALAKLIIALGAIDYAWVVAEAHRREALAALWQLAQGCGHRQVLGLRRLIPPLQTRPEGQTSRP